MTEQLYLQNPNDIELMENCTFSTTAMQEAFKTGEKVKCSGPNCMKIFLVQRSGSLASFLGAKPALTTSTDPCAKLENM